MTKPQNISRGLRLLNDTIGEILYFAGDRSVGVRFLLSNARAMV